MGLPAVSISRTFSNPIDRNSSTVHSAHRNTSPERSGSALMDGMYESADSRSVVKVKPVPNEID